MFCGCSVAHQVTYHFCLSTCFGREQQLEHFYFYFDREAAIIGYIWGDSGWNRVQKTTPTEANIGMHISDWPAWVLTRKWFGDTGTLEGGKPHVRTRFCARRIYLITTGLRSPLYQPACQPVRSTHQCVQSPCQPRLKQNQLVSKSEHPLISGIPGFNLSG